MRAAAGRSSPLNGTARAALTTTRQAVGFLAADSQTLDMPENAAYQRLEARFARIATIGEAAAMLGWDAAAVMHG